MTQLQDRSPLFLVGITIICFRLTPYPEERCLQDIEMPFFNEFGKELQKERDQKQTNMHAVHIGIRGDHHFVVPQVLQSFFNV